MAKGHKSSATSATRKKHAKKSGGPEQQLPLPKEKKKEKGKGKGKETPRPKVYIPPTRPTKARPDPLDTPGYATHLPPDLIISLRGIGKRDAITKRKGLEGLESVWVKRALGGEPEAEEKLLFALPVWLHHLPALLVHPSRRIRLLASNIHGSLMRITSIKQGIIAHLRQPYRSGAAAALGSWGLSVFDIDPAVAASTRKTWNSVVRVPTNVEPGSEDEDDQMWLTVDDTLSEPLHSFMQRTLFDPLGVYAEYADIGPSQAPSTISTPPPYARIGKGKQSSLALIAPKSLRVMHIDGDDNQTRAKSEEDEESDDDRAGRIRTAALGYFKNELDRDGTTPEVFLDVLSNPILWTSLYYNADPPFYDCASHRESCFGSGQPIVRKAAWSLLLTLLKRHKTTVTSLYQSLSLAVLRSAWVEPDHLVRGVMWEPLLIFLNTHPSAWIEVSPHAVITQREGNEDVHSDEDQAQNSDGDVEENEDEEDEDLHEANQPTKASGSIIQEDSHHKPAAYREFLQFLELGCFDSPIQSYPAIVVVLSTIPSPLIEHAPSSWTDFFTSFWAALDGRALSLTSTTRAASGAAFLSSVLECAVFLARRTIRTSRESKQSDGSALNEDAHSGLEEIREAVAGQFGRAWQELVNRRLRVDTPIAGRLLAKNIIDLGAADNPALVSAFGPIKEALMVSSRLLPVDGAKEPGDAKVEKRDFPLEMSYLKALSANSDDAIHLRELICNVVLDISLKKVQRINNDLLSRDEQSTVSAECTDLTSLLDAFGEEIFADSAVAKEIDYVLKTNLPTILSAAPSFLVSFLSHRNNVSLITEMWSSALECMAKPGNEELVYKALPKLLDSVAQGALPSQLHPDDDEMDSLAGRLLTSALNGDKEDFDIVRRVLERPNNFVSRRTAAGLIHSLAYSLSEKIRELSRNKDVAVWEASAATMLFPMSLLLSVAKARREVLQTSGVLDFIPDFYVLAFLISRLDVPSSLESLCSQAKELWNLTRGEIGGQINPIDSQLKRTLRDLIADVDCRIPPSAILESFVEDLSISRKDILVDLFPARGELEEMLQELPTIPSDRSLSLVKPIVPPGSLWRNKKSSVAPLFDHTGFSEYARVVSTLLTHVSNNRHIIRANIWLLRHFLTLSDASSDMLLVPDPEFPRLLGKDVSQKILRDIIERVDSLAAFLLSDVGDEKWHVTLTQILESILTNTTTSIQDGVISLVLEVFRDGLKDDSVRESTVLYAILKHLLGGATREDADLWIALARKIEKKAPQNAVALVFAVTESGLEPPKLDRYRNELAAGILGIRPAKANTDGLLLLRRLAATAPDPDSDVAFLPQPRAVNFMKTCQAWITSDEDINEDVEAHMTQVFAHLAPILQTVSGGHWDFIFDMIENNLENCTFEDSSSIPTLSYTLKLLIIVQELAHSSKMLRAVWRERENDLLSLVKSLVREAKTTTSSPSSPLSYCWEMALSIVQDLPPSLIDEQTLPEMVHILLDSSPDVQKMAYTILQVAAQKHTEHLVIEAGVDTSAETKFELPQEVITIIENSLRNEGNVPNMFGFLLGWMIVFDLFTDASLRVKMGYANQLRDLELVDSVFLPNILDLLDLHGGRGKPFPLEMWSVENYFVQFYEPEAELSQRLLAGHLFYRALLNIPSLISSWWSSCKDRQLSGAVAGITSRCYSPVLISAELGHVKDPEAAEELSGENWNVKVVQATNEAVASYTVDDQEMEIAVRLPSDYPLHSIEVREVRRLGVEEKRWRGWLLAVQQVITSQNGRIVDGLSMFKKNVTHHFENQTECAICYSILSVTELSLPKKRCRTCKNRFHASCLFKWFNTSHSSSCPLCRSDFI